MKNAVKLLRRRELLIALGIACVAGSASAQTAKPAPASTPRKAIEAANGKFSADFAKGDAAAVASHYTADAWAFPPNGDIARGRDAIGKLWKGAMDGGVKAVKLTTLEVEAHGDVAHEAGTYALSGEGGKALDTGKYVVVWKRQGGQWKIHRDIWNTSMPASK
jgi:uncharacterized protein (TIGR02246 family)